MHHADLPVLILDKIGESSMQDPGTAGVQRRPVVSRSKGTSYCLHADHPDIVIQHRIKHADSIRAAADTGNKRILKPAFLKKTLTSGLLTNDRLEIPDDHGEGMRAHDRTDQVVGVVDDL